MKQTNTRSKRWFGVMIVIYLPLCLSILRVLLEKMFSMDTAMAAGIATGVAGFTAYPFFIQGTVNNLTKDNRRVSFLVWSLVALSMAILMFLFVRFL